MLSHFRALTASLALAGLLFSQLALGSSALRAEGDYFRDDQGRIVFLRGVNVSGNAKVAPFSPLSSGTLDPLTAWGFNAIRLLFIWEAYEPEPGHYNEAYLQSVTELADQAWARGLYVIVDMHQDAYSRYVSNGCGAGFPAWAVPARYRRVGTPVARDCGPLWVVGPTLSSDMHHSFRDFYSDAEGARSAFLGTWSRLARHFSSHPGVIGYDLLNEPWGNELSELGPLYEDAARAIRREDPSAILFIEPQVFPTTFGMRRSQLAKPGFGNFAYAPHYYDPVTAALNSWALWRGGITRHAFRLMIEKAESLKAPLFVGEFGVAGAIRNARWFSDYQYDELDQNFLSSAQWNYTPAWTAAHRDGWNEEDLSIVDGQGHLRDNFYPRPFVRVLSGEPGTQTELRDGQGKLQTYVLTWKQSAGGGETELFVPGETGEAPALYEVAASGPGLSCVREPGFSRLRCDSPLAGEMQVRISRRIP